MEIVAIGTTVAALALALWALIFAIRGRAVILKQLIAAGVVEAGILLTGIVAGIAQATGHVHGDPFVLWGYLITALFILPVAAAWAFADRSATSSGALLVASLAVAMMMVRTITVAHIG